MLIQFNNLILSFFMAMNTATANPPVVIETLDNIKELSCLSQAIHGEASNQGLDGKLAVAHVIVNRSKSPKFPSDICSVVRQKYQFKFITKQKWINVDKPGVTRQMTEAVMAANMVLNEGVKDNTRGALYFINPKTYTDRSWLQHRKLTIKIQDHAFYS